jgi:hypothetical protein
MVELATGVSLGSCGDVQALIGVQRITVVGARGGQGASTVAAAVALFAAGHRPTRLVSHDLHGAAGLLGLAAPLPGDASPLRVAERLELGVDAVEGAFTVHDGGRMWPLADAGEEGLQVRVLRGPCYLAVRTLVATPGPRPDGIVLLREPGRSLTARDVTDVTGVPVIAEVDVTAGAARTIDAGLLPVRLHRLPEFTSLRQWTARHLAPRQPLPVASSQPSP